MTTGELLSLRSCVSNDTAMEHLNNICYTKWSERMVPYDEIGINFQTKDIDVSIEKRDLDINIESSELTINIETSDLDINLNDKDIDVNISKC